MSSERRADGLDGPGGSRRGSSPAIALAILVCCQLMVGLDGTVVNIALPTIRSSLHFSATGLSWVPNSYILAFGGLLLLGGRAGDILGRRRLFIGGIILFTLGSLLAGVAGDAGWLLVGRIVQGVGAAFAAPGTLALIATNFDEGPPRNRALGAVTAAYGLSLVVGLVLGGVLTAASWRWVFFVNLPIGALIAVLTPLFVRESERHPGRFDLAGAFISSAGMASLVYGFIRAAADGWGDPLTLLAIALGVALLAGFVAVERRASQPITPLHLFRSRNRVASYGTILLLAAPLFGMPFLLTQFLQNVLGFGPARAGFAFLPMAAGLLAAAGIATQLLPRVGAKPIMVAGVVLIGAGMLWFTQLSPTTSYATGLVPALVLVGVGPGCAFTALYSSILSGVPARDSGAASALLEAMQWMGGSVGLAVIVAIFGTASSNAARHPVAGASAASQAHHVLTRGMAVGFAGGVIFSLVALAVVLVAVTGGPAARAREPGAQATAAAAAPGIA
jgi:EmrB/QacA subfamily drug resistance transporter